MLLCAGSRLCWLCWLTCVGKPRRKPRKKQGKTEEFGSGVPKRSWLLGSAAHSCPRAFPCPKLFHLEGQTSRHTEGILSFQVQEKKMTNKRYLNFFIPPDQEHFTSLVFYPTSQCQFPSWKQFLFIEVPQDNPVIKKQNS